MEHTQQEPQATMPEPAENRPPLPWIRPRAMGFDGFFFFVYALVAVAFLIQLSLIIWPLLF